MTISNWITPEIGMLAFTGLIAIYTVFTAKSAKKSADEAEKQRRTAEFEAKSSRQSADAALESAVTAKLQVQAAQSANHIAQLKDRLDYLSEASEILAELYSLSATDTKSEEAFWKFRAFKEKAQFYFPSEYAKRMDEIFEELNDASFTIWEMGGEGEITDPEMRKALFASRSKQLRLLRELISSMTDFLKRTYH